MKQLSDINYNGLYKAAPCIEYAVTPHNLYSCMKYNLYSCMNWTFRPMKNSDGTTSMVDTYGAKCIVLTEDNIGMFEFIFDFTKVTLLPKGVKNIYEYGKEGVDWWTVLTGKKEWNSFIKSDAQRDINKVIRRYKDEIQSHKSSIERLELIITSMSNNEYTPGYFD